MLSMKKSFPAEHGAPLKATENYNTSLTTSQCNHRNVLLLRGYSVLPHETSCAQLWFIKASTLSHWNIQTQFRKITSQEERGFRIKKELGLQCSEPLYFGVTLGTFVDKGDKSLFFPQKNQCNIYLFNNIYYFSFCILRELHGTN